MVSRSLAARVLVIAALSAGAVVLGGGGAAFWLCLPGVLLASASSRTRVGAVLSAATVVALTATLGLVSSDRGWLPAPLLVLVIPGASVTVLVAVRERLEREREAMRRFALSDPLTGIANRRSLHARIEYEIARHTRGRSSFAVVMLDLDGFKLLNDRFGHAAGDELLRDVAATISRSIRGQDTVARIGGDEFCVLAPETDPAGAEQLVARIERALAAVTAGVEALRASSGVAAFPADGTSSTGLLQAADQRLLGAKRGRQRGRAARRAA